MTMVMDRQSRLKWRSSRWNDYWIEGGKVKWGIYRDVASLRIHLYPRWFVQMDLLEDYLPKRLDWNRLSCTNCE